MNVLLQNPNNLQGNPPLLPSSKVITVTPALAKTWLEQMIKDQRKPAESVVLKYSRAMKQGTWIVSAPLSFDVNGLLIDGQHRLLAVVKSGCNVDFLVVFNLPSSAINGIDVGTPRTAANLANLQGMFVGTAHFSILNSCFYGFESDALPPSMSKQEQVDMLKKHYEAIDFAARKYGNSGRVTYAPFLAPVARAYYSENHLRLEQFMKVLNTGYSVSDNPNDDSAAIALRNLYFKERQNTVTRLNAGSTKRTHDFRKGVTALKNFILRNPVKMVKESTTNVFPVEDFDAWWKSKNQNAA